MTDPPAFFEAVAATFPALRAELDDLAEDDLTHPRGEVLVALVQGAIRSGDLETVEKAFALVSRAWDDADAGLANVLAVSFLERLDFRRKAGRGAEARRLLPANLREALGSPELRWRKMFPGKALIPRPIPARTARRHS